MQDAKLIDCGTERSSDRFYAYQFFHFAEWIPSSNKKDDFIVSELHFILSSVQFLCFIRKIIRIELDIVEASVALDNLSWDGDLIDFDAYKSHRTHF